jgi:hypothetical protein
MSPFFLPIPLTGFDFAAALSIPHATKYRMAGGTMHAQMIKKLANQRPFRRTHANSRMNIVAIVMTAPGSSHLQARSNPKIATPHKLRRNQSAIGTGSVA